jgi:hypothetical protein
MGASAKSRAGLNQSGEREMSNPPPLPPEQNAAAWGLVAPPAAAFFETLTPGQQEVFQQAFVEDFRERQGGGPYGVTNEAIIAVGTKAAV